MVNKTCLKILKTKKKKTHSTKTSKNILQKFLICELPPFSYVKNATRMI